MTSEHCELNLLFQKQENNLNTTKRGNRIGDGLPDNLKKMNLEEDAKEQETKEQDESLEKDFDQLFASDLLPYNQHGGVTCKFLQSIVDLLFEYIKKSNDRKVKVLDFHHPHQLKEIMDFQIPDEAVNLEQVIDDCNDTLKYAVKTGHPRFFNQLSQGLDIVSLAGEFVAATTNSNMFTYEISPVYNMMEDAILKKLRQFVGWSDRGDGIFAPGGAISNLYAAQVARHKFFPEIKTHGMRHLPQMVMFTSEYAHYSITRAAAILGIGSENVIHVPVDERGKMSPSALESCIKQALERGARPFFVSCTAGTTVLGSFDPLQPIADICEKYGMWMHVDAAWGGGVLMSRKHRHLMDGVERADSVTWNPHKLMGALLQCSVVLFKQQGLMLSCNGMHASYLFQQDKHYDVNYDTGDKSIQCGRRVDVCKLWLMWRSKGTKGIEDQINYLFDLADYLVKRIYSRPGFEFVTLAPAECTQVCFWFVPERLRGLPRDDAFYHELGRVAPTIKERMMYEGTTMVGYQPLGVWPNFFRMVVTNPASTRDDIDFLLDEIERLGHDF